MKVSLKFRDEEQDAHHKYGNIDNTFHHGYANIRNVSLKFFDGDINILHKYSEQTVHDVYSEVNNVSLKFMDGDITILHTYSYKTVNHGYADISNQGVDSSLINDIEYQLFINADIGSHNINMAKVIVGILLKSPFNSPAGITLTADRPYQAKACIHVTRPAVLITYYGMTTQAISAIQLDRITYGSTDLAGSLPMDPRAFSTKPMSTEMYQLGKALKSYATQQLKMQHKITSTLKYADFNHCTILIYNPHVANANSKLPYHCDCI